MIFFSQLRIQLVLCTTARLETGNLPNGHTPSVGTTRQWQVPYSHPCKLKHDHESQAVFLKSVDI